MSTLPCILKIRTHKDREYAMKRVTERQKKWRVSKTRAILRRRSRYKRRIEKRRHNRKNVHLSVDDKYNGYRLKAPTHLSLLDNREETLQFFEKALNAIRQCRIRQSIYFDLKNVSKITPDAIMYIIALVNNVHRVRTYSIRCEGNLPDNEEARTIIERSGFYSHVSGRRPPKNDIDKNNLVQISCGSEADGPLIGKICDFVCAHSGVDNPLQTKRLYPMIIELMTNTRQHAYQEKGVMDNKWYIYVENTEKSIDFVFLDTGVGIPTTIRLNFAEKVIKLFLKNKSDAKFISSALKGAFRTETRQGHRGKGLPCIYDDSQNGNISELTIISGQGECIVTDNGSIIEYVSQAVFNGTLFCWKCLKHKEV